MTEHEIMLNRALQNARIFTLLTATCFAEGLVVIHVPPVWAICGWFLLLVSFCSSALTAAYWRLWQQYCQERSLIDAYVDVFS